MQIEDRLKFRHLQSIFFAGMVEYPNDKERMEKGFEVLEKWIDTLVQRECSKLVTQKSTIDIKGRA